MIIVVFGTFMISPVFGENVNDGVKLTNPLPNINSIGDLLSLLAKFVRDLVLALVPLTIIVGAWYILTAGGEMNKVNTGKKIIIFALAGLIIVVIASVLSNILADFLR